MNRTETDFSSLLVALKAAGEQVDAALKALLPNPAGLQSRVQEAMRYAIFAGGKRLRPFLLLQSAALFGVPLERALRAAAAIECVHTYSLVHDDLPCMDDDDLRRGRPTAHRAFDEATAVLAGDSLLTVAFEILADAQTHASGEVRARLVSELARAGGTLGMIGGQMIDIEAPVHAFGVEEVIQLQRLKTGALFEFCCVAGPILAEAGAEHENRLREYARDFGLIFQITDDLLDVLSSVEKTGKAVGKDAEQGKATLVSLLGIEAARARADELAVSAAQQVALYGQPANLLQMLPLYLLTRES
ncbi:MAG TPA: farnesyl diphosphate synthase [Rhizomicrobium sp.]|jgi:farnesyl diphosphate synthase|nr:farnesyl diphosphate synthase [Rhizomicrobium sp.]